MASSLEGTRIHSTRIRDKEEIGLNVIKARRKAGLSQKQLAKKLNIAVSTLASVELATIVQTHILDGHIKMICAALEIDPSEIMG